MTLFLTLRRHRPALILSIVIAAPVLPLVVVTTLRMSGPRLGPGVDRQVARAVSADARSGAEFLTSHPVERAVFPFHLVTAVWREAGHCGRGEPGGQGSLADYRAKVRTFGWFAVPGSSIYARCGGAEWSRDAGPPAAERQNRPVRPMIITPESK